MEIDKKYPDYGFAKHKGYPTKAHLEALEKYGIIDGIYRKSYGPVKKLLKKPEEKFRLFTYVIVREHLWKKIVLKFCLYH